MKVTFCTREFDNVSGGQNTWLCRFLPDLRRRGIEPRVLCFTLSDEQELPTVRSLRKAGVHCSTLPQRNIEYTEQQVKWILKQLAKDPPDVFVSNMVVPAAYYASRWLRKAGIATVGICHGGGMSDLYPGILDQFVLGRPADKCSAYVCVSKYLEQDLLERRPEKILIRRIPCGVPIGKSIAKRPNGVLKLAYVGQLVEERKRISDLTYAFCRVVREVPGTEALIYGDGPDRGNVERVLSCHGDGLPVHLAGFVENDQIQNRLKECHAVVLLSEHEGLGLALLEGMSCGLVPIGLRETPGVTEFVQDGVTGLLVENRGDALVAAVQRLREDPAVWERLSRSARAQTEAEYSDGICLTRWEELFQEVISSSGARKPLRIPWRVNLPPVHPALAEIDNRVPGLSHRVIRQCRALVSNLTTGFFAADREI